MAQFEGSRQSPLGTGVEEISPWAVGFIFFGSMMMMLLGSFHFIVGLSALLEGDFYTVRPGFALDISVTAWGWLHMIGGIVVMFAGLFLLTGSVIARVTTIILALASVMWNFYSIPYYPIWSVLMLGMGLSVLWALLAHGSEFTAAVNEE